MYDIAASDTKRCRTYN